MKLALTSISVIAAFAAVGGATYDYVSAPEAPFKMPDVPVWRVPAREFVITDYGAATSAVKNTEAFAKAIAACSAAGGGRVVVPAGDWRTGAIHFKNNVALDLREGSRLVFTDDPADYLPAVHTNWEGVEVMSYSPLIYAYCCTNIAIVGKGRIAPETNLWRKEWDKRRSPMHKAFLATLYDWCPCAAAPRSDQPLGEHPAGGLLHTQLPVLERPPVPLRERRRARDRRLRARIQHRRNRHRHDEERDR